MKAWLAVALLAACGTTSRPCGPATCAGCCDGANVCVEGVVNEACGTAGARCQVCSANTTCSLGACFANGGGAPDDGGVGGGGGSVDSGCVGAISTLGPGAPSADHQPGLACISCHEMTGAAHLSWAGTVFPRVHEPDLCADPPPANVLIEIADQTGTVLLTIVPRQNTGNFFQVLGTSTSFLPRIRNGGVVTHQATRVHTNPDCNACHTSAGANGAAGRLTW